MSSVEYLREFVNERLSAAAEEIFGVFVKTIVDYEEELGRQRKLLDVVWKPEIKLNRIELPQQHVQKEEEVALTERICIDHESNSIMDQEEPESQHIKEEEQELGTTMEEEQLVQKQENITFVLTAAHEERDECDVELNSAPQLPNGNFDAADSRDLTGGGHERETAEPKTKERSCKSEHYSSFNHCSVPERQDQNSIRQENSKSTPVVEHTEDQATELEQTFLRAVINEVLADLPEMVKDILEQTIQSLGVETSEDLRSIEEVDLLSVLKPIQARKLLAVLKLNCQTLETRSSSEDVTPRLYEPLPSPLTASSTSSNSCQSPDEDWVHSFDIPWDIFPKELMDLLEREKRPSPQLRRQMVRLVVDEMRRKSSCLRKRHSANVAKKMVAKYPKSLQDVIEGDVIGTGYHSLQRQLQYRIENVKSSATPKIIKRKRHSDNDYTGKTPAKQKAAIQDTYGCVRWDLKLLPLGESSTSQHEKKEKMKRMADKCGANPEEVTSLMKLTFYSQRKHINQGKGIQWLRKEWPFLFDELGMNIHYKELTGSGLKESFVRNIDLKGKKLLHYMNNVWVYKNTRFRDDVVKYNVLRGYLRGGSEDTKDMLLLLLSYFKDREDVMFCYVDDTCLGGDVPMECVPLTPTIIVCGQSCYSASRFMLSVDRTVVQDNIPCFVSAVSMMFGSYYCFNIHYPVQLSATLEFLQRCFFSINPGTGTKVENKNTIRRFPVNPRVLTLIQNLSDHQ